MGGRGSLQDIVREVDGAVESVPQAAEVAGGAIMKEVEGGLARLHSASGWPVVLQGLVLVLAVVGQYTADFPVEGTP